MTLLHFGRKHRSSWYLPLELSLVDGKGEQYLSQGRSTMYNVSIVKQNCKQATNVMNRPGRWNGNNLFGCLCC